METWKSDKIALLEVLYPNRDYSVEKIAKTLHRSTSSVRSKALELNLTRGIKRWEGKYDTFLKKNHRTLGTSQCAKILGYTDWHIQRRAAKLGLTKKIDLWTEKEVGGIERIIG